jgi:hypothetical protein
LPDDDYQDRPLFEEKKLVGKTSFMRNECVLFIDWCFLHNYEQNEKIAEFVHMVADAMAYSPARRFARNARGYFRMAAEYYKDALAALTVDVAYRATDRIIVRLEDIRDDGIRVPTVNWLSDGQKQRRKVVKRPTMLVNGEFRCLHRASVLANIGDIEGGFVTLRPFENSGVYDKDKPYSQVWLLSCRTRGKGDNKQFIRGESYFRQCRGIAIANFVGMEIGRITNGFDELAMESKDARSSRKGAHKFHKELQELLDTAEESNQFSMMDMAILRIMYNTATCHMSKPEMRDYIETSVNTPQRTFDRMVNSARVRFEEFCRRFLVD